MENPDVYKASMLPVITDTVLSLLPALSPASRAWLLGDETPEELVMLCKKQYNEIFDLYLPTRGLLAASEIAWHEVFADFNDDITKAYEKE